MPILNTDMNYKLSGGAANADGNLSLGGLLSSVNMGVTLHDLFDQVNSAESASGESEYRCIYIQNNHGTLTAQNMKIFFLTQTSSTDTSFEMGLGIAGIDTDEAAIADEDTPPPGVAFTAPATDGGGLVIPNLAPGQYIGVWIKRIINAASSAVNADTGVLRVSFDTAA